MFNAPSKAPGVGFHADPTSCRYSYHLLVWPPFFFPVFGRAPLRKRAPLHSLPRATPLEANPASEACGTRRIMTKAARYTLMVAAAPASRQLDVLRYLRSPRPLYSTPTEAFTRISKKAARFSFALRTAWDQTAGDTYAINSCVVALTDYHCRFK